MTKLQGVDLGRKIQVFQKHSSYIFLTFSKLQTNNESKRWEEENF